MAYIKCMFLPLKVQNPAILPRRPIHIKFMVKYGGLGSGEDRPPGEGFAPLRAKTWIWCRPQHSFRKVVRGRPISFLSVQKRNLTAPTAILPAYFRFEMVGFAPRGFQGRPGGLKNHQIIEGICELGGLRDLGGHFGPLACI